MAFLQLTTPSGSNLFSSATSTFTDKGPLELPETGNYLLTLSFRLGDPLSYQFQINDVSNVVTQSIQLNELVEDTVAFAGQQLDYTFNTTGPADVFLDAIATPGTRGWVLTDSAGNELFSDTNIRDRNFKVSLPAADTYTLSLQASGCLLYTSPSPRDRTRSRMPSSA